MMRITGLALAVLIFGAPLGAAAQDQTLADIRQEMSILYVELQKLKRELSTTGAPSTNVAGESVLERVSAIEAEMQRLTAQTERMDHRIQQVVSDGTNRIGDLEFRLCELEADCDISQLGETSTLGGDVEEVASLPDPVPEAGTQEPQSELAVGEQADFDAAKAVLEAQDYQQASTLFAAFNEAYPGSPLAAQAHLNRGMALNGMGDTREAARAYLASFTGDSDGPHAATALVELGTALGGLGQNSQACVTLAEVGIRFPTSPEVARSIKEMARLNCS